MFFSVYPGYGLFARRIRLVTSHIERFIVSVTLATASITADCSNSLGSLQVHHCTSALHPSDIPWGKHPLARLSNHSNNE